MFNCAPVAVWFLATCIHFRHLQCNPILDVDDVQFHFTTVEHSFHLNTSHNLIQYPFEPYFNLTVSIDFNDTIAISLNNEFLMDFFNIHDFDEIRYQSWMSLSTSSGDTTSSSTSTSSRRLLLSGPPGVPDSAEMSKMSSYLTQAQKEMNGRAKKMDREQDVHEGNAWRNRMFDRDMPGHTHPGYPNVHDWHHYRDNTRHKLEPSVRHDVLHRGQEIYDRWHHNDKHEGGDLPMHDPHALRQRFERHEEQGISQLHTTRSEQMSYSPPNEGVMTRTVPYHHGKYIGIPQRKTWFMAQQYCREQYGTNLASIMNDDELVQVRHVCDEVAGYGHCWIGLAREFDTWRDGKPAVFTNWGAYGVDNLHEQPLNCAELLSSRNEMQWNAQLCSVYRSFVCEQPRKRTRNKYIAVGKALSWESAENYCQETYNTDLATISNARDNKLVMNLCRDISTDMNYCWIGLLTPFTRFTDGSAVTFQNFKQIWSADHLGVTVHENYKTHVPEPYDEDGQSDSKYMQASRRRRRMNEEEEEEDEYDAMGRNHARPPADEDADADLGGIGDKGDDGRGGDGGNAPDQNRGDDVDTQGQAGRQKQQQQKQQQPQQRNVGAENEADLHTNAVAESKQKPDLSQIVNTNNGGIKEIERELNKVEKDTRKEYAQKMAHSKQHSTQSQQYVHRYIPGQQENELEQDRHEQQQQQQHHHHQYYGDEHTQLHGMDREEPETPLRQNEYETNRDIASDDGTDMHVEDRTQPEGANCAQINTSYGGVWRKARCSARYFFLCNNPVVSGNQNSKGMFHHKSNTNKHALKHKMTTSKREKHRHDQQKRREREQEREREHEQHERVREDERELERKRKRKRDRDEDTDTNNFRRRMFSEDDDDDEDDAMFLGFGGGGGHKPRDSRDDEGKITRKAAEDDESQRRHHKNHRRQERRRRRRRSRFKKWLKRHYGRGRGRRRGCGPRCRYHRMYIRTLPKDMHWAPLSGLLPMFGTAPFHHPKHGPKINIVAKVHMPKHQLYDNGELDYHLLGDLLFNDNVHTRKDRALDDFNARLRKLVKLVHKQKLNNLESEYSTLHGINSHARVKKAMREHFYRMQGLRGLTGMDGMGQADYNGMMQKRYGVQGMQPMQMGMGMHGGMGGGAGGAMGMPGMQGGVGGGGMPGMGMQQPGMNAMGGGAAPVANVGAGGPIVGRRRLMHRGDVHDDGDILSNTGMVSRCKLVRHAAITTTAAYEICVHYLLSDMSFRVDIKHLDTVVLRSTKRRSFRDVMDWNAPHYKENVHSDDDDEAQMIDHPLSSMTAFRRAQENDDDEQDEENGEGDRYFVVDPIEGNLGYAIYKYEAMNWHSATLVNSSADAWHEYHEFDEFENFIRFNEEFAFRFDGRFEQQCSSETLDGLPFRLCIRKHTTADDTAVYFEKDADEDTFDVFYSLRMKHFIDSEFEHAMFHFNNDDDWDEINIINMNESLQKCSYLHVAKLCLKRNNMDRSMTAHISFQYMNQEKNTNKT